MVTRTAKTLSMGVSAAEMDDVTRRLEKRVEEMVDIEDSNKLKIGQELVDSIKGKPFLYDVRCYNSKAVRQACIPAANGNFSARALAYFFSKLYYTNTLIKQDSVKKEIIAPAAYEIDRSGTNQDVKAEWAYGYKLFPFTVSGRGKLNGFGHAGVGGSIAMCIPHANLTVAITVNKLTLTRKLSGNQYLRLLISSMGSAVLLDGLGTNPFRMVRNDCRAD